jgi:hypothetical protein
MIRLFPGFRIFHGRHEQDIYRIIFTKKWPALTEAGEGILKTIKEYILSGPVNRHRN